MTLPSPSALRTLWQRDQDPSLDSLRFRLHLRLLLIASAAGLGLLGLRWFSERRLDLVPFVPLSALVIWAWLRGHPQHHRFLVRLGTLVFIAVGSFDLTRPGQELPWGLFALAAVPVYGTLLDGLVAGGIATVAMSVLWCWQGAHASDLHLRLLIIFNGLSTVCFYVTGLAYTWIFGALLQRQRLSQSGIEQAGDASRRLANTLADEVTVSVGRLRAALTKGLPDRRSLKDLQTLLLSTRQALPQDLPSASINPDQLLIQQRHAAHRAYLLLGIGVSLAALVTTLLMRFESWWIAGFVAACCIFLYTAGERLPMPWVWRPRLFSGACLASLFTDILFAGHSTPACSLAFLPLVVFYAGMLDSLLGTFVVGLVGCALLGLEYWMTLGHLWPFYGSLLYIIGLSTATMAGIGWAMAPGLRRRLAELAVKEEELRASLLDYRRVVSTLFHDLANPLAVLQTLASLPPALLLPEDQDRALRMVERLESVTQAARKQGLPALDGDVISLVALDGDLHDLFQERLDARRLTLRVAGPAGLSLRVSAALRDKLLDQVLSNAVRYGPEGGLILLTVEPHEGGLLLCLRDSGPGFPPDVLQDLGRGAAPQPKPDARGELGNGFGLLLAQAAARDLGGRLTLNNALTGGAQAELWLPG